SRGRGSVLGLDRRGASRRAAHLPARGARVWHGEAGFPVRPLDRSIPRLADRSGVCVRSQQSSRYSGPRLGRRTALTLPLLPPPQKNRSLPLDSSPDTATPRGISIRSRTSPVCGSMHLRSLSSPSQVPCHSSPSTQVTPVTKRLDSMVRRIAPV